VRCGLLCHSKKAVSYLANNAHNFNYVVIHLQIPLETGLLHPTRIDTHWWLPLQFCVLLLKMDANRVRNMYSDNKPSKTKAASLWLLTNKSFLLVSIICYYFLSVYFTQTYVVSFGVPFFLQVSKQEQV